MDKNLFDLRREYSMEELSESSVAADPIVQFGNWFEEYLNSEPREPNAFVLSTVDQNSNPTSRVVLLKGFDQNGFVFFTNYESKKARDLDANPNASLNFFWPELERQIRISGVADKTSLEESEAYFASRPRESQIGAWASKQSDVLSERKTLEDRVNDIRERFDGEIPCPPFWGGFRIVPSSFEFWQGRPSRLHDRIRYEKEAAGWRILRLYP
ncbi:MAG: pyridoxamine 5'-phosphate oxidase [Acidobacteria bacterium]|nr:MAG: pyridoxamine 5'-phosphate oxidase [Acidobacteriota bacterium]